MHYQIIYFSGGMVCSPVSSTAVGLVNYLTLVQEQFIKVSMMTITIQRLMQVLTALLLYACTLLLILVAKLQSHVVICTRILDDD
jgi:hypothetical protein